MAAGAIDISGETLAGAIGEFNRYSQSQIMISDPTLAELRIGGVFNTDRPENFLAARRTFYPIDSTRSSPRVIELTRREIR